MKHWLIKSEPETFSIDDLAKVKREPWSGVRNYQARNYMWKEMRIGDPALFYHSNAKPPGIVGLARVVGEPYPDPTQWDPGSEYFDPKSTEDNPRWWLVDFAFEKKFAELIPLEKLRGIESLADMVILQKGTRLSITPVAAKHFNAVMKLAR
ncbi:MAG: EVE domain-containing protein [Verrucomicrobia bacterium]|nr:EVE domain-containing protein [Verrucomicrobiota bacterium]